MEEYNAGGELISQWAIVHGLAFVILLIAAFGSGALVLHCLDLLDKRWSHRNDEPDPHAHPGTPTPTP